MTFLKEYIFTLCSLMVICAAIFTAVPAGETKTTLRSVIGIITALALISPFFGYEGDLLPFRFDSGEELVDYERAEQMEKRTLRQIEIQLENRIKELLGRECNVRVAVSAEGIAERVVIENVSEADKTLVSESLGIERKRITEY